MHGTVITTILVLLIFTQSYAADDMRLQLPRLKMKLEEYFRNVVATNETVGMAFTFSDIYGRGFTITVGKMSQAPEARPINRQTLFLLGSVSKTYIGLVLQNMIDKKEVALEDPIGKYFPPGLTAPTFNGQEIKFIDLVTHTSGLDDKAVYKTLGVDPNSLDARPKEFTVDDLFAVVSKQKLLETPGTEYRYSNIASALTGNLLARIANKTWADLVRERVFEPFELSDSYVGLPPGRSRVARIATGHLHNRMAIPHLSLFSLAPAGGIYSTIDDMRKYLLTVMGGRKLNLLDMIKRSQVLIRTKPEEGVMRSHGLFWVHRPQHLLGHNGALPGYMARMQFHTKKKIGYALLTNDGSGDRFEKVITGFMNVSKSVSPLFDFLD